MIHGYHARIARMDRPKTPLRPLEIISAADVRRHVDATGDANPLWLDDDFARGAGYRSCILPPTLVGWVPFSFKEGTQRAESRARRICDVRLFAGRVHQRAQRGFGDRVASAGLPGRATFDAEFYCRYRRASGQSRLGDLYQPGGTGAQTRSSRSSCDAATPLAVFPDKEFAAAPKDAELNAARY